MAHDGMFWIYVTCLPKRTFSICVCRSKKGKTWPHGAALNSSHWPEGVGTNKGPKCCEYSPHGNDVHSADPFKFHRLVHNGGGPKRLS